MEVERPKPKRMSPRRGDMKMRLRKREQREADPARQTAYWHAKASRIYNVLLRPASSTYVQVPGYYWDRDPNSGMWTPPSPTKQFSLDHEYTLNKMVKTPKVRSTTPTEPRDSRGRQRDSRKLDEDHSKPGWKSKD